MQANCLMGRCVGIEPSPLFYLFKFWRYFYFKLFLLFSLLTFGLWVLVKVLQESFGLLRLLMMKEFLELLVKVLVWLLYFQFSGVYPSSCGLQVSIRLWWFVGLILELQCWFPVFV